MTENSGALYREEFPILQNSTYLVSHSLGAMPRGVYDKLREYADMWATRGVRAWGEGWWEMKAAVGDRIAPLMGAPLGSVLVHENASIANSVLFGALDWSDPKRSKVVVSDQDFPSDVYTLRRMMPAHYQMHIVRSTDGITLPMQALLDAIDESTRIVSLSHVLFRTGWIVPAQAVIEKAHRVGAQVLLNGYHSVGIIPVDVTALGVDFYIGGTLKWMCGGPGGVFMYVRPDLLNTLEPRITGWFAHEKPFAFDLETYAPRRDSYRLANGTPAMAALYAIQPGIEMMHRVGIATIRAISQRRTAHMVEVAQAHGWPIRSPLNPDERGGMIVLDVPHGYEVSRELLARDIVIDYREKAGIRIAPHFYNTDAEVAYALETIQGILDSGDWRKHDSQRSFVT
jgi:kynureninase